MPEYEDDSWPTIYTGSAQCRVCGMVLDPLTVLYNGDVCTPDKRHEQQRLLANKRVGAL